jgi:peptidyl-prolyl cis-trans isomerase D
MLQSIREKTSGWIASIILGLIILTFSFFGIESYMTPKVETYAAKIEGPAKFLIFGKQSREISQDEFRRRFETARQTERQQQGDKFDAAGFETAENKRHVLDSMIDETVLELVAERDGLTVSVASLQRAIEEIDSFKVNGKFDKDQYKLALQTMGYTPAQFVKIASDDLLHQLIPSQLAASGLTSSSELDAFLRLSKQTRDIRYLELPPPTATQGAPTEADLQAWYDAHASQYRSDETVAIEYVELDAAKLPVDVVADEDSLRKRYEEEKSRFGAAEQRMASHILIKVADKATPAEAAAALEKAKALAAKARAPGADFAALAKANSEDLGSRDAGGDLGAVDKGVFGDAFDKAFFALQVGQISDPVRLPDGWHVILYRELRAGSVKPFEAVRAQLESEYLESERERSFNDISGKLVDAVYADPTTLAPAAKQMNLTVLRSDNFTRSHGDGIAAIEAVRKAAFANPQKIDRQVSDPVEIEPNHIIMLHVVDDKPAAAIPLAQVHDKVLSDLMADRLAKASKAQAEVMLARAEKGESLDAIATSVAREVSSVPKITRQPSNPQMADVTDKAFSLPVATAGKPSVALAKFAPDRFVLVTVTAINEGDISDIDKTTHDGFLGQLAKARGAVEAKAYIQALRKQYSVKVAEDRL